MYERISRCIKDPFFSNYRPQFFFRTTDVTGVITLPADKEMKSMKDTDAFDMMIDFDKKLTKIINKYPLALQNSLGY